MEDGFSIAQRHNEQQLMPEQHQRGSLAALQAKRRLEEQQGLQSNISSQSKIHATQEVKAHKLQVTASSC